VPPSSPSRRAAVTGILTSLAGVALFAWLVWRVGPREIWSGLVQIGWGMALLVVLGGLRLGARALAWRLAMEPPHRLRLRDAFSAVVCGDTIGNVITLGPIVSEAAKLAFVRGRVPMGPALTALAVENVLYTLSVAGMIAAGTVALLYSFELPARLLWVSEAALALLVLGFALTAWALWHRPKVAGTLQARLRIGPESRLYSPLENARRLEYDIYSFAERRRGGVVPIVGTEAAFHALGVLETHVTMWMILGAPPPLLVSFILEGAVRLIAVVFKVVPFQVGVGEAGAGLFTQVFGMGTAPGITLALARKARMGIWSMVGGILLVRHGLTTKAALSEPPRDNGKWQMPNGK
jgi:hypothetical protein